MLSRLVMTAILAAGLSASAQAQYGRNNRLPPTRQQQQQQQQQQMQQQMQQALMKQQPGEVQGTVEGVVPGSIMVRDANSQPLQVAMPPTAKVQVTGTATADYVLQNKKAMNVEFKAEVDAQGVAKEKVSELKIVALGKTHGLFPPESADDATADGAKPAKRPAPAKGTKAGAIKPGTYRIVGNLVIRNGKCSVKAGPSGAISLELGDQPTIKVESSDLSMVVKGDKISAKGMKAVTRAGTLLTASEVKIELAEPLAGKKKPAAKSDAKRPAKQPKADEE